MAFNQRLSEEISPHAKSFRTATLRERREFFRRMRGPAERALRRQLLRGRRGHGADGRPFKPRKRPRRDKARGPVLDPHGAASRTFRLLTSVAHDNGVTIYWHHGTGSKGGTNWGTILGAHAAGEVRGAPVRDARASQSTIAEIQRAGERIRRDMVAASNRRKPKPQPPPSSRPATIPMRRPLPAPARPWVAQGR